MPVPIDTPDAVVLAVDLDAGVRERRLGGDQRVVDEHIGAHDVPPGQVSGGVEVRNLSRDLARVRRGVEPGDPADPAPAVSQSVPEGVEADAQGRNHAHTGDRRRAALRLLDRAQSPWKVRRDAKLHLGSRVGPQRKSRRQVLGAASAARTPGWVRPGSGRPPDLQVCLARSAHRRSGRRSGRPVGAGAREDLRHEVPMLGAADHVAGPAGAAPARPTAGGPPGGRGPPERPPGVERSALERLPDGRDGLGSRVELPADEGQIAARREKPRGRGADAPPGS